MGSFSYTTKRAVHKYIAHGSLSPYRAYVVHFDRYCIEKGLVRVGPITVEEQPRLFDDYVNVSAYAEVMPQDEYTRRDLAE